MGNDLCSFCGNWGHYTFLSWLPTYFSEALHLNLTNAALVAILPSLGSILVSSIAAPFADTLISKWVETKTMRKLCQTIAFISPAICMTISSLDIGLSPWTIVVVLTTGLALSSLHWQDCTVPIKTYLQSMQVSSWDLQAQLEHSHELYVLHSQDFCLMKLTPGL